MVKARGKGHMDEQEKKAIKKKFLIKYGRCGVMHNSAIAAGTTVPQIRKWLLDDEKFAERFQLRQEQFVDALEMVAVQRAVEKSDTLLLALLKANRREKYRENHQVDSNVKQAHTVNLVFSRDEIGDDMPNFAFESDGGTDDDEQGDEPTGLPGQEVPT